MSTTEAQAHAAVIEAFAERDATISRLQAFLRVSRLMNAEVDKARLIEKINEEIRRDLGADRFTVFFHDAATDELYSYVASGLSRGEIRIPSTQGIAGHVFKTGETYRIADAYEDPHFNREVDKRTGYRTRSVLSLPVMNRRGVRIGVVQALNKTGGDGTFADGDTDFLREFVAQIADLLELVLHKEELVKQHAELQDVIRQLKVYDYLIGEKTATKVFMRWSRKLHIWISVVGAIGIILMAISGILVAHGGPTWWRVFMYKLHTGEIVFFRADWVYSDLTGIALAVVTITGVALWLYPLVQKRLRARIEAVVHRRRKAG